MWIPPLTTFNESGVKAPKVLPIYDSSKVGGICKQEEPIKFFFYVRLLRHLRSALQDLIMFREEMSSSM